MRLSSSSLLTLSLVSTTLIACGDDPPSPKEVRGSLASDLGYVLREGQASLAATDALPTGSAFGFATMAFGEGSDAAMLRAVAPMRRLIEGVRASKDEVGPLGVDEGQADTDAIVQKLNEELFTDANYEGDGVFRVPASLVCERTTYDETTGTETTAIDPDCANSFDKAQLRIRVASEDGGLRFYFQVDANHDEPLAIFLSHTKLAVTVNLDDATDAMVALAGVFGETAPNADLAGQVTGAIEIKGAAHAGVSLSFDRAIDVKFADQGIALDGPDAMHYTSAAGDIFAIDLDANANKASLDLGLGATTVHVPGDTVDPSTDIALGGATVNAHLQANTLTLDNISLGDSQTTFSRGGQQALAIDLNPSDGRSLDATITVDPATGDETLEVSPRLDLRVAVDHAALGDEAPVYDVTHVLIDGSLRGSALGDQVEVLTGSASIETNPAGYGFSATAGQCVSSTEIYDDVTFTSYTQYTVGACI